MLMTLLLVMLKLMRSFSKERQRDVAECISFSNEKSIPRQASQWRGY
jgi:hypothetical protein